MFEQSEECKEVKRLLVAHVSQGLVSEGNAVKIKCILLWLDYMPNREYCLELVRVFHGQTTDFTELVDVYLAKHCDGPDLLELCLSVWEQISAAYAGPETNKQCLLLVPAVFNLMDFGATTKMMAMLMVKEGDMMSLQVKRPWHMFVLNALTGADETVTRAEKVSITTCRKLKQIMEQLTRAFKIDVGVTGIDTDVAFAVYHKGVQKVWKKIQAMEDKVTCVHRNELGCSYCRQLTSTYAPLADRRNPLTNRRFVARSLASEWTI
jgi:hypothetical protein